MFCWASRPSPTDDFGSVFQDKPVALMASSPGRLGGVRAIPRLRDCVCELGMLPVPGFVSVGNAAQAFSDNGICVMTGWHSRFTRWSGGLSPAPDSGRPSAPRGAASR